ncbi:hypothetical protein MMPV_005232 [Pyropia vietnamensis]
MDALAAPPPRKSMDSSPNVFPLAQLPVDLFDLVLSYVPLADTFALQAAAPPRSHLRALTAANLSARIAALRPLHSAWVDSPLEHRNTPPYRSWCGRVAASPLEFVSLQRLVLGDVGLVRLPASIGECANLEVLYLDDNDLTTLPTALRRCTRLRLLDVGGNRLSGGLPPVLAALPHLSVLSVSFNRHLGTLPDTDDAWAAWPSLRRLGIGGCGLTSLPEGLLRVLDAADRGAANVSDNDWSRRYLEAHVFARYPSLRMKFTVI